MNLIGLGRFGVGISNVDESDCSDEEYSADQTIAKSDNSNTVDEGMDGTVKRSTSSLSLFLSFYAVPYLIKTYGLRSTIIPNRNLYFLFVSLSVQGPNVFSI